MHLTIRHKKHKLPIDYATRQPLKAIHLTLEDTVTECFRMEIYNWFNIATDYIYEDFMDRFFLSYFHYQLQKLVQALHIINIKRHPGDQTPIAEFTEATQQVMRECHHKLEDLYISEQNNPMKVVADFFRHISIEYARRELRDWLLAGLYYEGPRPEGTNPFCIALLYEEVLCLVEAAYALLQNDEPA